MLIRIYRCLCLFYPLNIHINEYVLFIDVFEFRNIKLEKQQRIFDLMLTEEWRRGFLQEGCDVI